MRRPPSPDTIAAVTLGPFDAAAAGAALARILDESGADAAVTIVPVPRLGTESGAPAAESCANAIPRALAARAQ